MGSPVMTWHCANGWWCSSLPRVLQYSSLKKDQAKKALHADLAVLLAAEGIDHERRSLRLPVREFDWTFGDDASLVLRFLLPRGTFATAVLHEVLADAWDAGEGGEE